MAQSVAVGINQNHGLVLRMIREFCLMIEVISSAVIMYLMIEHNDEQYLYLLGILNKCRLCNCFSPDPLVGNEDKTSNVEESIDLNREITVDTKTVVRVQMSHERNENSVASSV